VVPSLTNGFGSSAVRKAEANLDEEKNVEKHWKNTQSCSSLTTARYISQPATQW
jgi:hypothetical protein